MEKRELIFEGKAKKIYETDDPDLAVMEFSAKEAANNKVSAKLFQVLESKGVGTHFVRLLSETEMVVKRLQIVPAGVMIRNRLVGEMTALFGMEEGKALACPIYELHYKSDSRRNPLINEYHLLALKLAKEDELKVMRERSFQVNNILRPFFEERELDLIDFKLEFGRSRGKILLGDEISPDTCRLVDIGTDKKPEILQRILN